MTIIKQHKFDEKNILHIIKNIHVYYKYSRYIIIFY